MHAPPTKMAWPTVAVMESPLLITMEQPVMKRAPLWTCGGGWVDANNGQELIGAKRGDAMDGRTYMDVEANAHVEADDGGVEG